MMQFYRILHNTAFKRGMPEIYEIVEGLVGLPDCPSCGAGRRFPVGDLKVQLARTRAHIWPDALACGDYPCFVVSEQFVNAMKQCGIRVELGGKVNFVSPIENGLSPASAPSYFWIDGGRCFAGKMDFEASGYIDVRFCPECGAREYDVGLTYDRQHADPPLGEVFKYEEASDYELFTTDLSSTAFFCTKRVIDCARKHRLTNLAYRSVEKGVAGESQEV